MASKKSAALLLAALALALLAYLFLGSGSNSVSGEVRVLDFSPVEPDATIRGGMTGNLSLSSSTSREDLPPESSLGHRGTTLSTEGQILGLWEPSGLFSRSNGSGIRSRAEGPLAFTDGDVLVAPAGSTLGFDYGGEMDLGRDVFDALAFRIRDGELMRAEAQGTDRLAFLEATPKTRPLALTVGVPEMVGQETVEVEMDVPPGVYVVSVSASVEEGNARYNYRVAVK